MSSTASDALFRAAFDQSSQGMLLSTLDGTIVAINPVMRELLGLPTGEHQSPTIPGLLARPEQMFDVMEQLYDSGRFDDLELIVRHTDGHGGTLRITVVRLSGDNNHLLGTVAADRSQQDRTWGPPSGGPNVDRLVSDVAHDLNNVLSALAGYCHLLRPALEHDADALVDLAAIEDAGDRAAVIVEQLRAAGKRQSASPEVLDSPVIALPTLAAAGKRILVVEDDPPLRLLTRRVLELQGHIVVEAQSGEEAVDLLTGDTLLDLLITDMMMPGLKGWEVGRVVREKHPACGIIFMSGYIADPRVRQHVPPDGFFLGKPFTPPALVEMVATALSRAA